MDDIGRTANHASFKCRESVESSVVNLKLQYPNPENRAVLQRKPVTFNAVACSFPLKQDIWRKR